VTPVISEHMMKLYDCYQCLTLSVCELGLNNQSRGNKCLPLVNDYSLQSAEVRSSFYVIEKNFVREATQMMMELKVH